MRKTIFAFMLLASVIAGCSKEKPSPEPQTAPPAQKKVTTAPQVKGVPREKQRVVDSNAMVQKLKEMSVPEVPTSVTFTVDGKEHVIDDAELSLIIVAAEDDEADNDFSLDAFGMETFDEVFFTGTIPKDAGVAEAKDLINMQLNVEYSGDPAWPNLTLEGAEEEEDKYYAAAGVLLQIESIEGETAKGKFSGKFAEIVDDEVTDKVIQVRGTFTALLTLQ